LFGIIGKIRGEDKFQIVLVDFGSTDYNLDKLVKRFSGLEILIIRVNEYFSRGRGLNIGYEQAKYANVFFCDADMLFTKRDVIENGYSVISKGKIYFQYVWIYVIQHTNSDIGEQVDMVCVL